MQISKHGFHYRSSAQFYFIVDKSKEINTRLILFQLFPYNNKNNVAICVTLRDGQGCFVDRKISDFQDQSVIILDNEFWGLDNHFGSIENPTIPPTIIIKLFIL